MDIEQRQNDQPAYATATVSVGGANGCTVAITARNANGKPVGPNTFDVFLSDSPVGAGLTAVTASGVVQANTGGGAFGTDIDAAVAKKYLTVQCNASGQYILAIVDAAKTPFKVCVHILGITQVVATLATANYG